MAHILSETTTDESTLTYADNGIYLSKIISFMCLVARIVKNMRTYFALNRLFLKVGA